MKITCENCNQISCYDKLEEILEDCGFCKICGKEYCIHCAEKGTHFICKMPTLEERDENKIPLR